MVGLEEIVCTDSLGKGYCKEDECATDYRSFILIISLNGRVDFGA